MGVDMTVSLAIGAFRHTWSYERNMTSSLQPGSLYVLLDLRSPDLSNTTFHWALNLHHANAPRASGHKYHIKTLGDGWIADHAPLGGVLKSFLLVCLVRVACDVPAERWRETEALIRLRDGEIKINDGGITCRIWVMNALDRLRNAGLAWRKS
ncbi:uncharacterized protein LAESUDRAFT_808765 [Laetiporus sulphureus 93-53]|uniref:Uncharacterized protein n=1 Tax=Laetiporus sulphureus 93-53 TaxID=1314785 RepID=A0A165HIX3_9APHY|nr:uncharacterized protein LAESUDRAFT_808765 [Laetiporus sulphureus 93-53]KZT11786.1 hypothetical protein LAESUDRAFT_808765 [Laetiporus sulphureus 93-53]